MSLEFDDNAFEDLRYWVKVDVKKAQKIMKLIEEVKREPFTGSGKPEPLKDSLKKPGLEELIKNIDLFTPLSITRLEFSLVDTIIDSLY